MYILMEGLVWVGDKPIGLLEFPVYRLDCLLLPALEFLLLPVEELLERPLLLFLLVLVDAGPLPRAEPRPLPPLPPWLVPLPRPPLGGGPGLGLLPLERLGWRRRLTDLDLDLPRRPAGALLVVGADFFLCEAPPLDWPLW